MRRGLSLLEVVVAGAVLAVLTATLVGIYQMGLSGQRKMEAQTDAYRSVMLCQRRLRTELRAARLVAPTAPDQPTEHVTFLYPLTVDGEPQVDNSGQLIWGGAATLRLDEEGRLIKIDSSETGTEQVLADLGEGSLQFTRVGDREVLATIRADQTDPTTRHRSAYEVSVRYVFPNQ